MDKKYQIFISSTYEDLKEERQKVIETILKMHHFPIGMEMFNASDKAQWDIIASTIDESDYYVLILGQRYGSTFLGGKYKGMSYTEREFRYAKWKGIPILTFLIDDTVSLLPAYIEDSDKRERLSAFKKMAMKGRMASFWKNADELSSKLSNALTLEILTGKPRKGWCRSSSVPINPSAEKLSQFGILNISSEAEEISGNGLKENLKKTSSKQEIDIFFSSGLLFLERYGDLLSNYVSHGGSIRFLCSLPNSEFWKDIVLIEKIRYPRIMTEEFSAVTNELINIYKNAKRIRNSNLGEIKIADGRTLLRSKILFLKENDIPKWGWISLTLPPFKARNTTTLELGYEDTEDNILKKVSTHSSDVWNLAEKEDRVFTITEDTTVDEIKAFFGIKS